MNPQDSHIHFTRPKGSGEHGSRAPRRDRVGRMETDRPGPGEELNSDQATNPRLAATVMLVRGGSETLEVLLVQRNPHARFMGGAWVFPGGAVDRHEGQGGRA